MEKKPLRIAMPTISAFIDDYRAAFGAQTINAAIKAGMEGQPTFYASENGNTVGTPIPYNPDSAVSLAEIDLRKFGEVIKKHGAAK